MCFDHSHVLRACLVAFDDGDGSQSRAPNKTGINTLELATKKSLQFVKG
jgi:hypothetical protein